jgi:hypothetical protein
MGSLGDFGTIKPKAADTFGWFGTEIRVNSKLTDLVLMDFAEYAQGLDENSPEVMRFMKDQMRLVIDPDDFDAFWQGALDNGQDSNDLMTVMKAVIETKANRPTLLPADSSAGQPRTVVTSPDVSSLPDTEVSPLTAMDRRAIESLPPGRPDLALVVMEAAKQRSLAG